MQYHDDYILYQLTVEDAQTVALDVFERGIAQEELSLLEQHFMTIGLPDWYTEMTNAISHIVEE